MCVCVMKNLCVCERSIFVLVFLSVRNSLEGVYETILMLEIHTE
jgi:hypothetical protein